MGIATIAGLNAKRLRRFVSTAVDVDVRLSYVTYLELG
jgi:hypothetical protein